MQNFEQYVKRAKSMGMTEAKIIDPKTVVTGHWVRLKCQYGCGGYGDTLMCPPYSPTPEYTRKVLDEYSCGLLMLLTDVTFDEELKVNIKEVVADLEREIFLDGYYKAFGMGAGPCGFCHSCNIKKQCKNPSRARPSMEACGIDVYQTAKNHGYTLKVVTSEDKPCSLMSLILIE